MNITIEYRANIFMVKGRVGNHLLSKGFGTFDSNLYNKQGGLVLDPLEVLYIYYHKKNVSFEGIEFLSKEQLLQQFNISNEEFLVYQDLLHKGFYVKQALKFGAHFRIYDKHDVTLSSKKDSHHATHLVFICNSRKEFSPQELFSINRVAHSTKKKILLAFVDPEQSISYLEQRRWP